MEVESTVTQERPSAVSVEQLKRGWAKLPEVLKLMKWKDLRKGQKEVVASIMAGRDTICILPTSMGKSGCFTVPTLCLGWGTLVFSPLTALMRDQVMGLNSKRVPAMCVSGIQTEAENMQALRRWADGELSFLFVAPERIANPDFQAVLAKRAPNMIAIDEAHCISQWSDNFRSAYCKIGDLIKQYPPNVVAAFTATCPDEVEADIRRVLGMQHAAKLKYNPRRTNLKLTSGRLESDSDIVSVLRQKPGSAIVYCSSQAKTEDLAEVLGKLLGEEVHFFHSEISDSDKATTMDLFMNNTIRIICATNAFGMGVDKAQPLTTKVLTPTGWQLMGDLVVGDLVIGADGATTEVIAINDRGVIPGFRVILNDSSSTICADDHLWAVRTAREKAANKGYSVRKLSDIRKSLKYKSGNRKWFIPMVQPVVFNTILNTMPIDPYLLGLLLGDGGLSTPSVRFSTADTEIVDSVEKLIPGQGSVNKYGKYDYGIVYGKGKTNLVKQYLRQMGLHGCNSCTKFVPEMYLYSTVQNRISLIQGLFDTDGSVAGEGCTGVTYVTVSDALKEAVIHLVQSLGGTAKPKRKINAWYVFVRLPKGIQPFRLKRQCLKYKEKTKYTVHRVIEAVEEVGDTAMRCIKVKNLDGLYVTDDFIVTHNSNIRTVIHRDIPGSIEALAQEIGRAGRDGLDSDCVTFVASDSIDTQKFFIDCGYPSRQEITKLYQVLEKAQGVTAEPIMMTLKELSVASGIYHRKISAIIETLKSANIIDRANGAAKSFKVKLVKDDHEDAKLTLAWDKITEIGVPVAQKFLEVDMNRFISSMDLGDQTVKNYLRKWATQDLIRYIPPFRGVPTKIVGGLSNIDFDRLAEKAKQAHEKLKAVLDYTNTPDDEKHDFLEKYFNIPTT